MSPELLARCRELHARDVVDRLGLRKDPERGKFECPACASSDALHVYPGVGRGSYCWSCGESHDPIDLVRHTLGVDFKGAVGWLAGEFGFGAIQAAAPNARRSERMRRRRQEQQTQREIAEHTFGDEGLAERHAIICVDLADQRGCEPDEVHLEAYRHARCLIARRVFDPMWQRMALGAEGRRYLEARGIPTDVAEHIGIRSVETDAEWRRLRDGFAPAVLEAAGLQGRGKRGSYPVPWRTPFLVLPYWRRSGGLDLLRFRDLSGADPKYLSPLGLSPTTPFLAHAACDVAAPVLYVCEGELNALSVVLVGAPAVSSCGAGVWEADWSSDFRWFSRVIVLCDGDEAGAGFARRVAKVTLDALGQDWVARHLRQITLPDGQDANDLLRRGELQEWIDGR